MTASHCVSLGMKPPDRQRAIAEAVAAAGIAVVALPATNLFLQGRDHQQAMPRGLTAVRGAAAAGVVVAAGADNLQDPFNPLGRGCPFETAGLMVWTAHLTPADAWAASRRRRRGPSGAPAGHRRRRPRRPHRRPRRLPARGDRLRRAPAHVWHHGHRV